eukprot:5976963-Alexandrium_andersonii.AAC.1
MHAWRPLRTRRIEAVFDMFASLADLPSAEASALSSCRSEPQWCPANRRTAGNRQADLGAQTTTDSRHSLRSLGRRPRPAVF